MLSEFERRAWDTRTGSDNHPPVMALKVAQDDIEREQCKPKHVLIVTIEDDGEGGDLIGYYSAGNLSVLACEGAFGRAIRLMTESDGN